ncbi:MAG: penicillin-binding protein [Bryobacterales bacterium]|nr:penicillin-binding protein [Bryobacterales bacterium]
MSVLARITAMLLCGCMLLGATRTSSQTKGRKTATSSQAHKSTASKRVVRSTRAVTVKARANAVPVRTVSTRRTVRSRALVSRYSPWKEPTYADSTVGDNVDGEDLIVRRAAVEALGPLNGTVVAVEAGTGRILTIVNQKLALKGGYTPCSTVKVFVGMGALSEGVIERTTQVRFSRRMSLDMTDALARSDNAYFARLGQQLGFDRVSYYAKMLGLGERATLGLDTETPGTLPLEPPPDGVGMMSSFGHGIFLSPLQLASTMAALANGGTLYYLQYPQNRQEAEAFVPRVKRHLEIQPFINDLKPGLMGAVAYGTARRAGAEVDIPVLGKTGTCTDRATPTHLGWFGSFSDTEKNKLAVVVLLTGGKPINGPVASGVAGKVYKTLADQGYFEKERPISPVALVGTRPCCVD